MATLAVEAQDGTKTQHGTCGLPEGVHHPGRLHHGHGSKDFNGVSLFSAARDLTVTTDGNGGTFSMAGVDLGAAQPTPARPAADISTTTRQRPRPDGGDGGHHAVGHGSCQRSARTKSG